MADTSNATVTAAATVGTHPKEAHELALQASYRIEGLANVLQRELTLQECGFAAEHILREIHKLNSVVMSVLAEDAIAQLANFADVVGVEVSYG